MRKGAPGMTTAKIENKIALRCVQNADMTFERCFVPDSARLPGARGGGGALAGWERAWVVAVAPSCQGGIGWHGGRRQAAATAALPPPPPFPHTARLARAPFIIPSTPPP